MSLRYHPLPATRFRQREPYLLPSEFSSSFSRQSSRSHSLIASGITKGPDNLFGDQHLKTAVALIELHKTRHGRYPASLDDLKFTGEWDQIALRSVRYYPNSDGTAYFIEVERGWIGKPKLEMPVEFWKGTGYSPSLRPSK